MFRDLAAADIDDSYSTSMIEWAIDRQPGQVLVRAWTPDIPGYPYSVIEIVTDDMPFLVDSVTAEMTRVGRSIHLIAHPQFAVTRVDGKLIDIHERNVTDISGDMIAESWMHIYVERDFVSDSLAELVQGIERVLADVRKAVLDWTLMRTKAIEISGDLRRNPPIGIEAAEIDEAIALLDWLTQDSFTFVGYREYLLVTIDGEDALAPIHNSGLGILRDDEERNQPSQSFAILPAAVRVKAREREVLVLSKANSRSTVHRPGYLDYVGVKIFNELGEVIGERRFLGLYAARAYSEAVLEIPVLREKARSVERSLGFVPDSHSAKDLEEFLDTYPRDELFQITIDQLAEIAKSVLTLQERRQTRLYLRNDPYGRFVSALVYFPRDRYTTAVRLRLEGILCETFGGTHVDYSARVSESVLARLHYIVHIEPGEEIPQIEGVELERRLAAATRSWEDDYQSLAIEQGVPELIGTFAGAFPESYKEDFSPNTGIGDSLIIEKLLPDELALDLYAPIVTDSRELRFKVIRIGPAMPLTRILPILERLGVDVLDEHPHEINRTGQPPAWVLDFGIVLPPGEILSPDSLFERFEDAFRAAWFEHIESDSFNSLVVTAGLTWRDCMIIRAYARYMRQIGSAFGQGYIESVMLSNSSIARLLVDYFRVRFDPQYIGDRESVCESAAEQFEESLTRVPSLDHDRILRLFWVMISATMRTNYYQDPDEVTGLTPAIAFKLAPRLIPDLPLPRPEHEIWVYSPQVEAVHLRFGAIARGGLRWSDRREDFRTEILGLVKAQEVKNAVIVPVGAKGGFFAKKLPDPEVDKAAWLRAGVRAYQDFIESLLSVTDNFVQGVVEHPRNVVCHDSDDTYLVVAADKGTASFSDIANRIAMDKGYWLGDAFASGGSAGYDHKKMGITAKGAWESVKRHFFEMEIDTQSEDFTVVGIGDMSGDVFGNGMLLSDHIRLVAAFDHRNIFIDPQPNPVESFKERSRLFNETGSSWMDYNTDLISQGGGVFMRSAKSIPLTPEMRAALDINIESQACTPDQLISFILRAPVQLLWNGGIGTYVKASTQTNIDVGDKANDAIRINGSELRAQVIGEGGNLGLTQLGRVEAARSGVRLNTDAIDNSAGVDTSDHEVNIKILLAPAVASGDMTIESRDKLLIEMTETVSELVLRDNFDQNVVLSNARAGSGRLLNVHQRMIKDLERKEILNRALENLPDDEQFGILRAAGLGLTSPELAVLLAYAKIDVMRSLNDSDFGLDAWCDHIVADYFPDLLVELYRELILEHPLRAPIANTVIANQLINIGGVTFVFRAVEETGASTVEVVKAALAAMKIFGIDTTWQWINKLPVTVPVSARVALHLEVRRLLDRAVRWFLQNRGSGIDVAAEVDTYADTISHYSQGVAGALKGEESERFLRMTQRFIDAGAPVDLARRAAGGLDVFSLLDIAEIARKTETPIPEVIEVYFTLSERFEVDRLLVTITGLPRGDRWTALARQAMRTDLYAVIADLTLRVLETTESGSAAARVEEWESIRVEGIARTRGTLDEILQSEEIDLATLSVALRVLRNLVAQAN
jgi:glutamate dehydrogenase